MLDGFSMSHDLTDLSHAGAIMGQLDAPAMGDMCVT